MVGNSARGRLFKPRKSVGKILDATAKRLGLHYQFHGEAKGTKKLAWSWAADVLKEENEEA